MLGSLADTGLDLLASLITLYGVRVAAAPADREHRFGHGKAEALAALAPGRAHRRSPRSASAGAPSTGCSAARRPPTPNMGIGVSIVAIVATLGLLAYQRRVIARTGSVAIETDHVHYQSDLLLNLAVIAALVLDQYLGLDRRRRGVRNRSSPCGCCGAPGAPRAAPSTS